MAKKPSIETRALRWIVGHHTGLSSKAIWAHMMGVRPGDGWNHPRDPADLSRCLRLLRAIPEWNSRLPEMAKRSRYWRALVRHWDEIVACMEEEAGRDWSKSHMARKTYDLMRSVIDGADRERKAA